MHNGKKLGFSLVELLVVLSILALLLTLAVPRYFISIERAKETSLKQTLNTLRESIDKYYADTGHYPETLEDLVENKYIRNLPIDPFTDKNDTWVITPSEESNTNDVYDVHSGAQGIATDGTGYANW